MGTIKESNHPDQATHQRKLHEILEDAGIVMLACRRGDELHGRPMAVAKVDPDGTMYFATGIDTAKVDELRADPRVDIFFQSKTRYATVAGTARVVQDRALISELWKESWKVWFPDGKGDPDISIIVVEPTRGEYWDQSGMKGLSFLFRAAKAYVTGTEAERKTAEDHGKVRL